MCLAACQLKETLQLLPALEASLSEAEGALLKAIRGNLSHPSRQAIESEIHRVGVVAVCDPLFAPFLAPSLSMTHPATVFQIVADPVETSNSGAEQKRLQVVYALKSGVNEYLDVARATYHECIEGTQRAQTCFSLSA